MKLDLILENTRNKYTMGLLEESTLTELDLLKGKVMINESTMTIRKMLIEEGTMESIKSFLEESWSYALLEEMAVHADSQYINKNNNGFINKLVTTKNRNDTASAIREIRAERDVKRTQDKIADTKEMTDYPNRVHVTTNGMMNDNRRLSTGDEANKLNVAAHTYMPRYKKFLNGEDPSFSPKG